MSVQRLIRHVGCGDADNYGLCEECNDIRSALKDTERLNWLQKQLEKASYTGLCVFRWSTRGRGWRLHETSPEVSELCGEEPVGSVREAIDRAMARESDESDHSGVQNDSETENSTTGDS